MGHRGVLIYMRRALVSYVRVPLMVAWTAVAIAAPAGVGFAQESRAALIAAEQTKKAATLTTRVPSAAERTFVRLQQEFMQDPNGFYPWLGSVYSGGGFTLGAGYRQFYGDRTHVDLKGMYSAKNYKLFELSTDSWDHASGRIDLHGRVGWRDATQVAFHGLGMSSPPDETDFRMKQAYAGGDVVGRPLRYVVTAASLMVEDYTMEPGTGSTPSIEEVFTPDTAPGLGDSPSYVHTRLSAGIDTRASPGYARRGGLVELTYHNYADRGSTYSFDRLDAELVRHVPLLRENWVLSFHGLLQTTLDDTDTVPYFLLPSLGSGSTLRAYSSWRFRDRTAMVMSGEFRWIPNKLFLDMAVFYDTGKVTPRFDDLSFRGLASDVGVGVRFHTLLATPLRVEMAKGREGWHLVFAGSAAF
jgi:hypothetical protein